jgi:protein AIR1/2
MSGPFFDADPGFDALPRKRREWEDDGIMMDGWGLKAPTNVGEKGRSKDRKRLAERARQADENQDEDDWFNDPNRNIRIRGAASSTTSSSRRDAPRAPQGIKFTAPKPAEWRSRQTSQPAKPLWARLSEGTSSVSDSRRDRHERDKSTKGSRGRDDTGRTHSRDHSSGSRKQDYNRGDKRGEKRSEREWDRGKVRPERDRDHRERNRDSSSRRDDRQRGPRYHGGYDH